MNLNDRRGYDEGNTADKIKDTLRGVDEGNTWTKVNKSKPYSFRLVVEFWVAS